MVWRLDDHTVMTNTPWFDGNHSHHQHHCGAQHPHPTHHSCHLLGGALTIPMPLCAPPVAWKAWCCACHVLPFHSFHSCPPLCPSHSLCVIGSHSVSNTFTSERVTVTHTPLSRRRHCGWHTANKAHWLMHTSITMDSRKTLWLCVFGCDDE